MMNDRNMHEKRILFYLYDGMADFEFTFLAHLLGGDCGFRVITFATDSLPVRSKSGVQYLPHLTTRDVVPSDYDGVIIPGGWLKDWDYQLPAVLQSLNNSQKLVAAICAGPWILGATGILKGRKYTTSIDHWSETHERAFGRQEPFDREFFTDARVQRDGHVITAKGIAFVDFAVAIVDYFNQFGSEQEKDEFLAEIRGGQLQGLERPKVNV